MSPLLSFSYIFPLFDFFFAEPTYPRQSQRAGRIRRTLRIPPSTPLPGWSPTSRSECSGHRSYYIYVYCTCKTESCRIFSKTWSSSGHLSDQAVLATTYPPRTGSARIWQTNKDTSGSLQKITETTLSKEKHQMANRTLKQEIGTDDDHSTREKASHWSKTYFSSATLTYFLLIVGKYG